MKEEETMIKKYIKNIIAACSVCCCLTTVFTACSDSHMQEVNTDDSKAASIEPSAQLTTALLQTYGDFSMMDTYRCYITGFTQHFAGGWNVTAHAGSVYYYDDYSSAEWKELYSVGIKNIVDAIANSVDKPNTNAALRIQRVLLMSILTDTYGDVPCSEAGLGYISGITTPVYDKQEDIYNFFFEELAACVAQLGTGNDNINGDVTSLAGDINGWKRYANSLRLRFAMRISDVDEKKAKTEFQKALTAEGGYITSADQDAYVIYTDGPFTLYDGAADLDFRVNALGEMLYGQDPTSPTLICSTFFNIMKDTNDPRLYRICRHYLNTKRTDKEADREWTVDVTDEVVDYLNRSGEVEQPNNPGAAWYNDWVNAPANKEIPTLERLVEQYPDAGFDGNNFPARMMRPWLSIDFEMPDRPGALINYAEVEFLLAEAALKKWIDSDTKEAHFKNAVTASIAWLNNHYLQPSMRITDNEVEAFLNGPIADKFKESDEGAKEAINTEAWILHMMNPSEAWANMRRSDYPVIMNRTLLPKFDGFTYGSDLRTPTRLCYPKSEEQYNNKNYNEALKRMGSYNEHNEPVDDWHAHVWWDRHDYHVK